MKELEVLLNKRWVLKSEEKELYYRIRDSIGEIRRFASDKMGCQVIENPLLVKMEKIPAIPETFMGIRDFTSKEEYVLLCILLMFLEDKDAEEQFILSQLTEYVEGNMPGGAVDWTVYTNRRRLVKVLRFAVSQGILRITDGSEDVFMDEYHGEVLYENTGVSRYFMRNFARDIMEFSKPEDFRESDWYEMNEDRGILRRHRVYQRLLFSVGMYKDAGPAEDFDYLKYYGRRMADDLEQYFDCRVHLHRGSAFFLMGEDCRMGEAFPGNNGMADLILLCCCRIRTKAESGEWNTDSSDRIRVDIADFERLLKDLKAEEGAGFTKQLREKTEGEFVRMLTEEMEKWTFIELWKDTHEVVILPSCGKMAGSYPEDFTGGHRK